MQAEKRSTMGRLSEFATDAVGALGKSLKRIVPRARDDALMHIPDEIRPPLAKFRLLYFIRSGVISQKCHFAE